MATAQVAIRPGQKTRPARSLWKDAWVQFRHHKLAMAGLGTLVLLIAATLLGPYIYTTPIGTIDFTVALSGPSAAHPFGTDDEGRDLLARVLWGGRVSIAVGLVAVLISVTLGTLVGLVAGYFQKTDNPLMRLTDLFLSLPQLPLLLIIIYSAISCGRSSDPRSVSS